MDFINPLDIGYCELRSSRVTILGSHVLFEVPSVLWFWTGLARCVDRFKRGSEFCGGDSGGGGVVGGDVVDRELVRLFGGVRAGIGGVGCG
jgi:hypothetical protein